MAETTPNPVAALQPGDVIHFADLTELVAFEDLIAPVVKPDYDPDIWAARVHLRNLIRPPKFNGTIADIELTKMADPYDRLNDARDRGFKLGKGNYQLIDENLRFNLPNYHGFTFTAKPRSTKPGDLRQIQTELWYYPYSNRLNTIKAGTQVINKKITASGEVYGQSVTYRKDSLSYATRAAIYGDTIKRVVAKPILETERFIKHHDSARHIGFAALRDSMMNPFGGLHD